MNPNYAGGISSPSPTLGIISLILGGLGICLMVPTLLIWFCGIFPFVFGIAAIIGGILALTRIKRSPERYSGKVLAILGIVLGIGSVIAPTLYAILNFGILAYQLSKL